MARLIDWLRSERGQDLVEYGLIAALISVICISAIAAFGQGAQAVWERIAATVALVPH